MAGLAWDLTGPWGAFILMAVWAFGGVVCALILPPRKADVVEAHDASLPVAHEKGWRALLPKLSDYATAFGLLATLSVAVIVLLGSMMHGGNAVQSSFYVAWLNDMGIAGTAIGLLSPAGAVGAALFSLLTARLSSPSASSPMLSDAPFADPARTI